MVRKVKRHIHKWWHIYLLLMLCLSWLFTWCRLINLICKDTEKESLPKQDSSLVSEDPVSPPTESKDLTPILTLYNVPLDLDTQVFVQDLCNKYNLDVGMVYGIMYVESRFDNTVKNGYCVGIMQTDTRYMPDWLRGETWNSTLEKNILAGIKSLASWRTVCELKGYKDNVYYLLGTYNQGYKYFETLNDNYAQSVIEYAQTLETYTVVKGE